MIKHALTNLQIEILKLYSTEMNENELIELKKLLAENYGKKAINEADRLWEQNQLTNIDMENWLNGK